MELKLNNKNQQSLFLLSIHSSKHQMLLMPGNSLHYYVVTNHTQTHTNKQSCLYIHAEMHQDMHTCTKTTRKQKAWHAYLWKCMIESAQTHTDTHIQTMWLRFKWSNFSKWTVWGLVATTSNMWKNQSESRMGWMTYGGKDNITKLHNTSNIQKAWGKSLLLNVHFCLSLGSNYCKNISKLS